MINVGDTKERGDLVPVYGVSAARMRNGGTAARDCEGPFLDAIVFDIQDVGVRFWTYETTLGFFLEAAAAAGTELIVLDRPNPITGAYVQGPISDPGLQIFTNYHPLPVRVGGTG